MSSAFPKRDLDLLDWCSGIRSSEHRLPTPEKLLEILSPTSTPSPSFSATQGPAQESTPEPEPESDSEPEDPNPRYLKLDIPQGSPKYASLNPNAKPWSPNRLQSPPSVHFHSPVLVGPLSPPYAMLFYPVGLPLHPDGLRHNKVTNRSNHLGVSPTTFVFTNSNCSQTHPPLPPQFPSPKI